MRRGELGGADDDNTDDDLEDVPDPDLSIQTISKHFSSANNGVSIRETFHQYCLKVC